MLSDIKSLIVATMSGNYVPSMPLSNNPKYAIGSPEAMNPAKQKYQREIDDTETLAAGASAANKWMERMKDMYLKKCRGKPKKTIRTLWTTRTLHQFE